ncbi:hypothetical protein ACQKCH_11170 [Nubsella zeaxanthinifaciens]|uniref:hypothetical protein n=1 Tax=Nubsella zeaxanthinifaciens TaxID=392412 RepID=UPI003D068200
MKNRTREELTPVQEKVAKRMAAGIVDRQRKLAGWLNYSTRKLTAKAWLILLAFFCLLFGGYCLYLLVIAFRG